MYAFREYDKQWRPVMKRQKVVIVSSDVTGRKLVQFPDGYRDWISSLGIYQSETL